jgi:hypothetical protein
MGKVSIDGSEITAAVFSDWILGELGWPNLHLPKGLHLAAAKEQVPLIASQKDLDQECAFPGPLLLDNPYQQGIAHAVVRQALTELAQAAHDTGTQVISTQTPRAPAAPETIHEIRMPKTYAAP